MSDKESTCGVEIISHTVEPWVPRLPFEPAGTHNRWYIRIGGRVYYVSHRDNVNTIRGKMLGFGPECIAFDAAEIDGEVVVTSWSERAVSHAADPLDALADVVEQLEENYGD